MSSVRCSSSSRSKYIQPTYSKPRFIDFSYTAESSSCLYRNISSSRPKSTLADGGLLAGEFVEALLNDIIGDESVTLMTREDDLFMRAAMPAGLTRRRRGERSAKPDADGSVEAIMMATMAKVDKYRSGCSEWLGNSRSLELNHMIKNKFGKIFSMVSFGRESAQIQSIYVSNSSVD
eukprot:scaffold24546_cov78-Skeletonema_dohrnii-CCMP3373.AAC.1